MRQANARRDVPSAGIPFCSIYGTIGAQNIDSDTETQLELNNINSDPSGMANLSNFSIIIREPGYYVVDANGPEINDISATADAYILVKLNGNDLVKSSFRMCPTFDGRQTRNVAWLDYFEDGDELTLWAWQNSGFTYGMRGSELSVIWCGTS